jgi:hypothetical protein
LHPVKRCDIDLVQLCIECRVMAEAATENLAPSLANSLWRASETGFQPALRLESSPIRKTSFVQTPQKIRRQE